MGVLADWQIEQFVKIVPFEPSQARPGVISYGVTSYGYDLRVARHFKVFTNARCAVVDPKNFDAASFIDIEADTCLIPPNSFALAETVEYLEIPRDVVGVCVGKSTYARCFSASTCVALADGTTPTLADMARRHEAGELFWGYSIGPHGRLMVTLLDAPRYIGRDGLMVIALDDGGTIQCTPDHEFMLRDGRMISASTLKAGDSLMPLYRERSAGNKTVYQPIDGRYVDERHLLNGLALSIDSEQLRFERATVIRNEFELAAFDRTRDAIIRSRRVHAFRELPAGRNHKVIAVRDLPGEHDVYCLTVPEAGNFALAAGVFVANCGIIVNVTPLEPEWKGKVTIEISNTTPLPARIYAGEGIAQVLFIKGDAICKTSYADKKGKYQNQPGLTLPFVLSEPGK